MCSQVLDWGLIAAPQVNLPSPLLRDFYEVLGVPRGKRVLQAMSLPNIFVSTECPKSVVREFLGGLFGGDGTAPLSTQKGWASIGFSMCRVEEHMVRAVVF